jgi:hypothetical protein
MRSLVRSTKTASEAHSAPKLTKLEKIHQRAPQSQPQVKAPTMGALRLVQVADELQKNTAGEEYN